MHRRRRSRTWEPTTTKYAVIRSISNPVDESTATFKSRAFINYRNASNSMHYLCELDFVGDATASWHFNLMLFLTGALKVIHLSNRSLCRDTYEPCLSKVRPSTQNTSFVVLRLEKYFLKRYKFLPFKFHVTNGYRVLDTYTRTLLQVACFEVHFFLFC